MRPDVRTPVLPEWVGPAFVLVRPAEVLGRYSRKTTTRERIASVLLELSRTGERKPTTNGNSQPHALVRRLGRERVERVVADYLAGNGCTTLARQYGVSENGILALLKRSGIELRPPVVKVTADEVVEMLQLRSQGWTYRAIGERYGSRAARSKIGSPVH